MKLFIRKLIRFSLPILCIYLLLLLAYIIIDPFKVVRYHQDYSSSYIPLNRDYISTESFLSRNNTYHFNSFIFGSSRARSFSVTNWMKHLPTGSKTFAFDASAENIKGILSKLKYLDTHQVPLKNVLIIICRDASFSESPLLSGHLFVKHPAISGDSRIAFQLKFLQMFNNPLFLVCYIPYIATKNNFFKSRLFMDPFSITYDTITNQAILSEQEQIIKSDSIRYYKECSNLFPVVQHPSVDSINRISPEYSEILKEIKKILLKNNTQYKLIISPLYDQMTLTARDMRTLRNIFGENLFDFSGANYFTSNKGNYYESSHYRPFIGDSILNLIYK